MPVISSSSGNRGSTSDDVEEMKLRRTPEHMKGQRSDPLEPISTQIPDRNFLHKNTNGSQVKPATISADVHPSRWSRLLGRLRRFGKRSSSTPISTPPASTASPPALLNSKTSSFHRPSLSDPPPTVFPCPQPDDSYSSGDPVVGVAQIIIQRQKLINPKVAAKRPEQKTSITVNNSFYGGTGGPGGRGLHGRGGDGGIGEGPTVNYHMQAVANVNHIQRQGESGFHILHHASADAAVHNSAENYTRPKCHPETRTKMLEDLWEWSLDSDPSHRILWFYGPAGAGKSSVARSFCQKLEEVGRLGASFFFQRGHPSRGSGHTLFPTIAYQLCLAAPEFKHIVSQLVEDDPAIINRSLSVQLQRLIIEPCRRSIPNASFVIVIDGLDECEGRNIQEEILQSFGMHQEPLPLLFFIASRPEAHLREIFISALEAIYRPVNVEQSFDDVRKYLQDEFARIHRDHRETMATVPFPWPTPAIVNNFVDKSSGYFIYASTVIRFIDDKDFRPTERLQVITGITEPQPDSGSPFSALDSLYTQILLAVPRRPHFLKILAVIAAKILMPISFIDQLLELDPGEVRLALRGLRSVIGAKKKDGSQCNNWSPESTIVVHHASLYDFLQDPMRARIFYVGDDSIRTDLCRHILKALSYNYDNSSLNRHGFVGG
ncbi:putative nwd2 protein [Mycena venus]|uniref:Putative nwd2 protein n=1 Tax=Mycena venus TaxID=2733690 RepID=A0A8H6Z4J0_9AGAR|nr:putative nwd2 protein [Mycena venus]